MKHLIHGRNNELNHQPCDYGGRKNDPRNYSATLLRFHTWHLAALEQWRASWRVYLCRWGKTLYFVILPHLSGKQLTATPNEFFIMFPLLFLDKKIKFK